MFKKTKQQQNKVKLQVKEVYKIFGEKPEMATLLLQFLINIDILGIKTMVALQANLHTCLYCHPEKPF